MRTLVLAWLLGCGATAAAAAADEGLSVAGFRPGMPAEAAYQALQKYAGPRRRVAVGRQNLPDLSPKPIIHEIQMSEGDPSASAEVIQMDLTLPPQPQVVWRVVRRVRLPAGQEVMIDRFLESLQAKYGREARTLQPTAGVWWYDPAGRPAPLTADMKCDGIGPVAEIDAGFDFVKGWAPLRNELIMPLARIEPRFVPCRSWTKVAAVMQLDPTRRLVTYYTVEMADMGLQTRAQEATLAQLDAAAKHRDQQVLDRAAKQPKPSL
jgi:hypothetical protein